MFANEYFTRSSVVRENRKKMTKSSFSEVQLARKVGHVILVCLQISN